MWTKEEQKEHREELVAALRSGDYKQCTSTLYNGEGYCCLGVAEKIRGSEFKFGFTNTYYNEKWYIEVGEDKKESSLLTEEGCNYYGIRTSNGDFYLTEELLEKVAPAKIPFMFFEDDAREVYTELTTLNDEFHFTFSEIAAIIEAEPRGLLID